MRNKRKKGMRKVVKERIEREIRSPM